MKLDMLRAIGKPNKVQLEWKPVQRSEKWGLCCSFMQKKNLRSHFHNFYNEQTAKQVLLWLCSEIALIEWKWLQGGESMGDRIGILTLGNVNPKCF